MSICRAYLWILVIFVVSSFARGEESSATVKQGDLNRDGKIDQKDYTLLLQAAMDPEGYCAEHKLTFDQLLKMADINLNGRIDFNDPKVLKDIKIGKTDAATIESERFYGGKTWFPIGVWLQNPKDAPKFQELGINIYIGLWKGPTAGQIRTLEKYRMPVICLQNKYALENLDKNVFYGWLHRDEPDNCTSGPKDNRHCMPTSEVNANVESYKRKDPNRPVMLNLGCGVGWDEWWGRGERTNHPEDYPLYYRGVGIAAFDIYPFANGRGVIDGDVWRIGWGVRRMIKWTEGKAVAWTAIETGPIHTEKGPTPDMVRNEVWMAIIHGARGIFYFVHRFAPSFEGSLLLHNPPMAEKVTQINKQVEKLSPVIFSIDPTKEPLHAKTTPDNSEVHYVATVYEGALYVFAVPYNAASSNATFNLSKHLESGRAEVLGENRFLPVRDGVLMDQFSNWSAHLYKIELPVTGGGNAR